MLWHGCPTNLSITLTPDNKMLLQLNGPTRDKKELKEVARPWCNAYLDERKKLRVQRKTLFPTLEETKRRGPGLQAARRGTRKLTPEELERVKANGYRGGLLVVSNSRLGLDGSTTPLQAGDKLVGLHVWPTESLEQVAKILSRDDLDQLSPLKFYVIRRGWDSRGGGGRGGGPPAGEDGVVTGRIQVDLSAWHDFKKNGKPAAEKPTAKTSDATASLYDGKTFEEWKQAWRRDLSIEFRISAVRAFVAFANSYYDKEIQRAREAQDVVKAPEAQAAVQEILEIAEQYDWSSIGNNQLIAPLQTACVAVFDEEQISSQLAIEVLITLPNAAKNKRFMAFFNYILPRLSQSYVEGNKALRHAFPDLKIPLFIEPEKHNSGGGMRSDGSF